MYSIKIIDASQAHNITFYKNLKKYCCALTEINICVYIYIYSLYVSCAVRHIYKSLGAKVLIRIIFRSDAIWIHFLADFSLFI